jgi:hypothetical protein
MNPIRQRPGLDTVQFAGRHADMRRFLGAAKEMWRRIRRTSLRYQAAYIRCREDLPYLLNARKLLGEGVEVGVQHGYYSEAILKAWKGKKLYSVDPWLEFRSGIYDDIANVSQSSQDAIYRNTLQRLSRFGGRSTIIRATSKEAAAKFQDRQLDFVYIDAQHDYEAVKDDIGRWFPKIRTGGVLAGHDYLDGQIEAGTFGVKSAVDEFSMAEGLRLAVSREKAWRSWFVFVK